MRNIANLKNLTGKEVVTVTNFENNIQNYMLDYDARNEMRWDYFIEKIKTLTQSYGFELMDR